MSKYLHCEKAFDYTYSQGLEPLVSDSRPTIGSAVHFAVGMAILTGGDEAQLAEYLKVWEAEENAKYQALPAAVAEGIAEELHSYVSDALFIAIRTVDSLRLEDWQTISLAGEPMVEWEFEREVPGVGIFTGAIDWVAWHNPTQTGWLMDHKIRATITNAMAEDYNIQMAVYQDVLQEEHGIPLAGSLTNQISSKIPKWPQLTKAGAMSRAAISTDWATYRAALIEAGLNPDDYADMQEKLLGKVFYDHTRYYRSRTHVRNVWNHIFVPAAKRMRAHLESPPEHPLRNMNSFSCRGCGFSDLCLAELRGDDTEYLRLGRFRRRDTSRLDDLTNASNSVLDTEDSGVVS